jgi:hypothetical protein
MDFEGIKGIIGLIGTFIVVLLTAFYRVGSKFSAVHVRIDEVKDGYVRREDFAKHMERQEKHGEKLETAIDKLDGKLDKLIARN